MAVVTKCPADFIGQHLGQSEAKTKAILDATVGKVLIIDEAYGLNSTGTGGAEGTGGTGGTSGGSYKTAVIDTLVAEVQAVPGDDRCVLLLGYEDELKEMFRNVNPGLSRRFASENPFRFEDFDLAQLENILKFKLKEQDLSTTPDAMRTALDMLDRARMRPNFSNAGEVNNLLDMATQNYLSRQTEQPPAQQLYDGILEPADFDPDFDRSNKATCRKYLENKVASEIIDLLESYQRIAISAKDSGHDLWELVPTRFIFRGPSG